MVTKTSAADFLPAQHDLASLATASEGCRGCDLYRNATQTVFGAGPPRARLMLVGEQPGDREDIEGKPFVGPAGRMLDKAIADLGLSRDDYYVTNIVKHFKWRPKGKRRIHETPRASEVRACLPWLEAEIDAVRPELIACLGATAVAGLLGASAKVTTHRGKVLEAAYGPCLVTTHPSSILRVEDPDERDAAYSLFLDDLRAGMAFLERSSA
jgi:uracil-DNA glycosylase family protein